MCVLHVCPVTLQDSAPLWCPSVVISFLDHQCVQRRYHSVQ